MFIVFNKKKIYSYLVSLSTVVVLFSIAFTVTTNESITTSSKTNEQSNTIENVNTNNDIMLINVDDNWNENNIQNILEMLESTNTKASFEATTKWINENTNLINNIKKLGHEINIKK